MMTTKLERGGVRSLVVGPLKKYFLPLPLPVKENKSNLMRIQRYIHIYLDPEEILMEYRSGSVYNRNPGPIRSSDPYWYQQLI